MRIWKGKEKEISIFYRTEILFIKGETVNIQKILDLAIKNGINYLYFGAGKTELKEFEKLDLIPDEYEVILETVCPEKIPKIKRHFTLVFRVEVKNIDNDTFIKIETEELISTYYLPEMNRKSKHSLGLDLMYAGDQLLLEDGE